MPVTVPIQTAFNGGYFGPLSRGRTDIERRKYAAEEIDNFFVTVQGPVIKRSGTKFVKSVSNPAKKSRLIPFEYSETQSYVIEISEGEISFFRDSGAITEATVAITGVSDGNPVVITAANSYSAGDEVFITGTAQSEINGRFFTVATPTGSNFELSGEDGTGRSTGSGGTAARVYRLLDSGSDDIPWLEAELDAIQYAQNGDLLYLVHPNHPPHILTRDGALDWTCLEMTFTFPPLGEENTDDTSLMSVDNPIAGTSRTVSASGLGAYTFTANDTGRILAIGEIIEAVGQNGEWSPGLATGVSGQDAKIDISTTAYNLTNHRFYYNGRVYRQTSGSGDFGFSAPVHEEGSVGDGKQLWTFCNWGWGYGTVTYASSSTVTTTPDVDYPASAATGLAGAATDMWAWGAFDAVNGYPAAVAFYEDRLWFGGTPAEPQTVWGSRTGKYDDFRVTPADLDDTGVKFTFLSERFNKIEWLKGDDVLYGGTRGGEFTVDAGTASQAITPSNIRVRRRSNYGTKVGVQPLGVESTLVFARQNHDVHELAYDFNSDRFIANELTRFADAYLKPGITSFAYQADPYRQIWALRSDGTLAACTFVKQEEVVGWGNVSIGGTNVEVESIAVIPHPDGDEDQLWMTVKRTVNGSTVRYVEYMEKAFDENDTIETAFFVDSGLQYSGAETTTLSGLWHLEGETVQILADGSVVPDAVVTNGQVTLSSKCTKASVGLAMPPAKLKTTSWEQNATTLSTATSQSWPGRVTTLAFLVDLMGEGLEYGTNFDTMKTWYTRKPDHDMDAPPPLFSGWSPTLDSPSGFEQERRVAFRHGTPTPCTVVSVVGKAEHEVR